MTRIASPAAYAKAVALASAFLVAGCSAGGSDQIEGRWYSGQQVSEGHDLFVANCASCHGMRAEGTTDWKRRDAQGRLPPPPLNGTAHAWHHPVDVLDETIVKGGAQWGGTMPPFGDRFSEDQRKALIAFVQSLWSDEIYTRWLVRNGVK